MGLNNKEITHISVYAMTVKKAKQTRYNWTNSDCQFHSINDYMIQIRQNGKI